MVFMTAIRLQFHKLYTINGVLCGIIQHSITEEPNTVKEKGTNVNLLNPMN